MKALAIATGVLFSLLLGSCSQTGSKNAKDTARASASPAAHVDDDGEVVIPADEIPAVVVEAALAAAPGLVIEEAERETEDGELIYCVHGTLEGVFTEVEVSADGSQADVEEQDGDDDGDDDDDDDD